MATTYIHEEESFNMKEDEDLHELFLDKAKKAHSRELMIEFCKSFLKKHGSNYDMSTYRMSDYQTELSKILKELQNEITTQNKPISTITNTSIAPKVFVENLSTGDMYLIKSIKMFQLQSLKKEEADRLIDKVIDEMKHELTRGIIKNDLFDVRQEHNMLHNSIDIIVRIK